MRSRRTARPAASLLRSHANRRRRLATRNTVRQPTRMPTRGDRLPRTASAEPRVPLRPPARPYSEDRARLQPTAIPHRQASLGRASRPLLASRWTPGSGTSGTAPTRPYRIRERERRRFSRPSTMRPPTRRGPARTADRLRGPDRSRVVSGGGRALHSAGLLRLRQRRLQALSRGRSDSPSPARRVRGPHVGPLRRLDSRDGQCPRSRALR